MLRISYSQTELGQRWTLSGQLGGPWVPELRSFWQRTRQHAPALRSVVDLSEVTLIDNEGQALLSDMRIAGVEFVAVGVATKHLLASLKSMDVRPAGD